MITNYLYTIGKYLPPKTKDEVLKDIEVNLYDYLEENFGKKEYSNEEIEKAIRTMGHPRKVAEAYMNEPRCLIGAAYIDTYWLVIKITLFASSIGLIIASFIDMPNMADISDLVSNLLSEIWESALSTVGLVTIIFALIQYYNPNKEAQSDENWSLSILEKSIEKHQKIKVFDLVAEIFFSIIGLIAINSIIIGDFSMPMAMQDFNYKDTGGYLIGFNFVVISSILLNIYLLIKRQWQSITRIISISLNVLGALIFTQFALNPEILRLSHFAEKFGVHADKIVKSWSISVYVVVAIIVIAVIFNTFTHAKALIMKK
jgi:hypothetical protein